MADLIPLPPQFVYILKYTILGKKTQVWTLSPVEQCCNRIYTEINWVKLSKISVWLVFNKQQLPTKDLKETTGLRVISMSKHYENLASVLCFSTIQTSSSDHDIPDTMITWC
jgi:hypothetical protein